MIDADRRSNDATRPLSVSPIEPFVSYAQNHEDVMLYRALRDVECGRYVDIGAAEPEADSVTCAFYRRGWRGVNVEPTPDAFSRLAAARPGDINLNVAVGDRDGQTSFFLVDGGNGLSTAVRGQMLHLLEQGWHSTEVVVPVRTLASIFAEYADGAVHFLKIDAEGSERPVLAGADFVLHRPWIVLVEATAPNSQTPTYQDWEDILLAANYIFVWFDGLNRFYVAAEKKELSSAFHVQPNVFDSFIRHTEFEANQQLAQARSHLADSALNEQQLNAARRAAELEANEQLAQARSILADAALNEQQLNAALRSAEVEISTQREHLENLKVEVTRTKAELDAWMQELFETNRHAAHLTQERQTILHFADETMAALQASEARRKKIKAKRKRSIWQRLRLLCVNLVEQTKQRSAVLRRPGGKHDKPLNQC